jgi:TIR domain
LSGNPVQCSCHTLNFLRWMESNKRSLSDFSEYSCFFVNGYLPFTKLSSDILVTLDYECSKGTTVIVSGTLLGLGLILMAASACCYRHRWEIRYACLKLTQRGQRYQKIINEPVEYEYDAFVVYDSEDRQWVNDQLLPHLELQVNTAERDITSSPRPDILRLCVHERDFPPGQEIIGNIWNKMEHSRKVILVVSKNFTKSHYCDYEMNLARMQSIEQGRSLLIPILLELPDVDRVSDCLHWVLRRVTYLEWPQSDAEQDQFWKKLKMVLNN